MINIRKNILIETINLIKPFFIIYIMAFFSGICMANNANSITCKICNIISIAFFFITPISLILYIKNIYLIFRKKYKNKQNILKLTINLIFNIAISMLLLFILIIINIKNKLFHSFFGNGESLFLIIIFATSAIYIFFYIKNI